MSKTPSKLGMRSNSNRTIPALKAKEICNSNLKFSEHQNATTFVTWYKNLVDNERQNLSLYLSDDAVLEWFGRTIKTRKKIAAFLNHDMQCSRHDFTTVEVLEKIPSRQETSQRMDDPILASPLHSPELARSKPTKRKYLRVRCNSPEWAEGCRPDNEEGVRKKRFKTAPNLINESHELKNESKRILDVGNEISNHGDCMEKKGKCVLVTPPNMEVGQGDCLPSTSGTDSDRSHDLLTAQLSKTAVECNGYIEFTRTRNNRSIDSMTWDRKCKVQISYSNDPLNIGEYIIWMMRYNDENKCRRNLLNEFKKAALDEKF